MFNIIEGDIHKFKLICIKILRRLKNQENLICSKIKIENNKDDYSLSSINKEEEQININNLSGISISKKSPTEKQNNSIFKF